MSTHVGRRRVFLPFVFPMTILMTADTIGGVWTYCIELARALAAHDIRVVVATMGAPLSNSQQQEAAQANVQIEASDWKLEWMPEPWRDVDAAGEWLLELEKRIAPDLVHLNGYAHGALPWRAPLLVAGHSCVLSWWRAVKNEDAPPAWNCYRDKVRAGLHAADVVVAPTQAMLDALHEHYGALPRTRVIFNGRDAMQLGADEDAVRVSKADDFTPPRHMSTHAGAETVLGEKEALILAAGRVWDEAKNIAALKRIAPRIAWPIFVAGDEACPGAESMPNDYRATTSTVDIGQDGFHLLGKLQPSHLARWMKRAAIYALPARYEPFGLSALEAALCGCALVLGDIPSLREVWREAAVFVSPHDDCALEIALQDLIEDEPRRSAMARAARERAHHFTTHAMAASYEQTYRELMKNRAA